MSLHQRLLRAALCASFSLPIFFATGCSDDGTVTSGNTVTPAKGNWQISSSATVAAKLPVFSGELTTQGANTTGIFHSQSASACIAPSTPFEVSGTITSQNGIVLTGALANGTLTVTGMLAADGKSLTNATYNVTGGACALAQTVQATAQAFTPITGSYKGNFADGDGNIAQVTAVFSQSPTSDANGNFTLAGTASVTNNNPCFPSTLTLTNTQVTGGTFTYTLSPANTANANGNSVTATGTFSSDATTLTITNWTSAGTCGADTGIQSAMARQGS